MKILLKPILIIIIFLIYSCKSSLNKSIAREELNYIPYYLKVYEADSLFLTNNFEKSYVILDNLFKNYKPIEMEGFYEYSNYTISAMMSGRTEKLKEKVKYGILNFGGVASYRPNAYKMKDSLYKVTGFKKSEIDSLKKEYFKHINIDLRKRIEKICMEDQSVRINSDEKQMKLIDRKNQLEIDNILNKYGYPDSNLIGSDNYFENTADISVIFLHQDDSIRAKYLPILLGYVKKGKCNPIVYTALYDRRKCDTEGGWEKCKQYYGTYINQKGEFISQIENPINIDSIRKSIGLYHKGYNTWRNEYVIKNSN